MNPPHLENSAPSSDNHAPLCTTAWAPLTLNGPLQSAVLVLMLLVFAGCSSFPREWRKAAATPVPAQGLAGRWEGSWLSDVNGHRGRLRAIARPLTDQTFEIRFRATYAKILRFSYTAQIQAVPQPDGRALFSGEADLGIWGRYHFSGHSDDTQFRSTYETRHDRGTFEMTRVRTSPKGSR